MDRAERGSATAEDRRYPTFRAAVARVTSVDSEVFYYLTSPVIENPHLATVLKIRNRTVVLVDLVRHVRKQL